MTLTLAPKNLSFDINETEWYRCHIRQNHSLTCSL